ncbi:MAG: hypothetical protein LBL34_03735 [Clostridiales bacterium]|jgi:polyhydroxyalkanoate synthesis regulator phasin|nr:hypothetical protein [Clostridiales bacterium]
MGKKGSKRLFWLAAGVTAGVMLAGAAKKVKEDIDNLVDDNRDFGKQTKEWFTEKRKHFKELIDAKNTQIEEISAKLKADVIKEIDEFRRRDLVEEATRKIARLKDEIKKISTERRDQFLYYIRKANATKIADFAQNAGVHVKNSGYREDFTSKGKPVTDMDFEEEIDIELIDDDIKEGE